jgi:LacI family gluconate utilization system Gnt-I transcriptional repressor
MILTGMVRAPAMRNLLHRAGVPVVETWDLPSDPIDMVVGFSHESVGAEVAAFMLKQGYKKPHLLCADSPRAHERRQGFVKALQAKGKREPPCELVSMPSSVRAGRESLAKLLTRGDRPDFIMCSSDLLALGVLLEAAARGLRIPDDLEVFGFGDMQFASEVTPPLSTVRIDGAMIGKQTAKLLVERAAGRKPEQTVIDVGFTIVDRSKGR